MDPSTTAPSETLLPAERCPDLASLDELRLPGLSEFFDPFLAAFARDTLRTGGEVWVSRSGDSVDGLYLYLESERQGAVFTHSRPIAESFSARHSGSSTYSDFPLGTRSELFWIYEGTATGPDPSHRFRHPVRAGGDEDRLEVLGLMRGVHGVVDDAWFTSIAREKEVCFVVEGDRELAGVGWASVSNGVGRLHSLSVRPRYRRTGVGTDLWHARMRWAAGSGAGSVVTEISEHNPGSRAIAEAGGMRWVGQIYRSFGR